MAKSRSRTQTVANGCVGQKARELSFWQASQHQRPQRVSRIQVQGPQGSVQEEKRPMIVELERYKKKSEN